jgi:hypothetical protein
MVKIAGTLSNPTKSYPDSISPGHQLNSLSLNSNVWLKVKKLKACGWSTQLMDVRTSHCLRVSVC